MITYAYPEKGATVPSVPEFYRGHTRACARSRACARVRPRVKQPCSWSGTLGTLTLKCMYSLRFSCPNRVFSFWDTWDT